MRNDQPSLTAWNAAMIEALLWCEEEGPMTLASPSPDWPCPRSKRAKVQAELLRSLSAGGRYGLPFIIWLATHFILSCALFTKLVRKFVTWLVGRTMACEGVWMRKSYMENQVRAFLDGKHGSIGSERNVSSHPSRQVLIIAAGYDTLAVRLACEYPDVRFFEIDHPATGSAKLLALERMLARRKKTGKMVKLGNNMSFYHADLAKTTLRDALSMKPVQSYPFQDKSSTGENHFEFNVPTAVVVEGLTMYLTAKQVYSLFDQLADVVGVPCSRVSFDFFTLDELGRPINPNTGGEPRWLMTAMKCKVKIMGEPFKWGISPDEIHKFVVGTGWSIVPTPCGAGNGNALLMGLEYEATVEWSGKEDSRNK